MQLYPGVELRWWNETNVAGTNRTCSFAGRIRAQVNSPGDFVSAGLTGGIPSLLAPRPGRWSRGYLHRPGLRWRKCSQQSVGASLQENAHEDMSFTQQIDSFAGLGDHRDDGRVAPFPLWPEAPDSGLRQMPFNDGSVKHVLSFFFRRKIAGRLTRFGPALAIPSGRSIILHTLPPSLSSLCQSINQGFYSQETALGLLGRRQAE